MLLCQNVPDLLAASPGLEYPGLEYLYKFILDAPLDTQSAQGIAPDSPSSRVADPSNFPPQLAITVDDMTRSCVVYSASTSVPPPTLQTIIPSPCNWYRIPQKAYGHGQKQWDFTPSECVSFKVDGFPGVNMRDAFRKRFTGLVGRDDLVLQDARNAISCRLLVRLS